MVDYELGWDKWGDMVKYSPAPYHRRRLIMKTLEPLEFSNILDVGCGNGILIELLRKRFPLARIVGVDFSEKVISENQSKYTDCEFYHLDISSKVLEDKFDLVICSEVIEHIEDYLAALRNLRKMAQNIVIVTVPAGRIFPIDKIVGHYRHFTKKTLSDALKASEILPQRIKKWGFPFHTLYKYVINIRPQETMSRFGEQDYSASSYLISQFLRALFFLNSENFVVGNQLIAIGRVIDEKECFTSYLA